MDAMKNPNKEFENIIEQHKTTIYSVCFMYASNRQEADDLFQEILINLWQGLNTFRFDSALKSWIYRIALNTSVSYKRKKHIKTEPLDIAPQLFQPETYIGKQNEILRKRISRLEPIDRAIVLLWLEDMSYEEIGSIIGITPKNVGVKLIRIKEKLKKMNINED